METDLFGAPAPEPATIQSGFDFPASLTEKYRPRTLDAFVGLDKPKKIARYLIAHPKESAFLFSGPSGTGKTTLALALAELMPAELHHVPSQECNLANIEKVRAQCQYVPRNLDDGRPCRWHLVLADEIDQLTGAAQISLLSKLDGTNRFPNTIFIGTTNLTIDEANAKLERRFVSRFQPVEFSSYGIAGQTADMLAAIWRKECAVEDAKTPDFARIVKDSKNNVRASLMALETELMCA